MTEFVYPGPITSAATHMGLLGLGVILDDAGMGPVRVQWAGGRPRQAMLSNINGSHEDVAAAVQAHAAKQGRPGGWLTYTINTGVWEKQPAAVMSPRIKRPTSKHDWALLQEARHYTLDTLTKARDTDALRQLGSLGEMGYWVVDQKGDTNPERAASSWDMKTRNRGQELVQHRLQPLAEVVANRTVSAVLSGLLGESVNDEHGKNDEGSRTSTGLTLPGLFDNALAWCALWGWNVTPPIPAVRGGGSSATPGYVRRRKADDVVVLPYVNTPCTIARMRSIMTSKSLAELATSVATGHTTSHENVGMMPAIDPERAVAEKWLQRRSVQGVLVCQVLHCGSSSAPERQVRQGTLEPLGG